MIKKPYPKWRTEEPLFLEKNDNRYNDAMEMMKTDGFSFTELWCLNSAIAMMVLPRLKAFREQCPCVPMGLRQEEWQEILDDMIFAFDWGLNELEYSSAIRNDRTLTYKKAEAKVNKQWARYKRGMRLFGRWFMALWW